MQIKQNSLETQESKLPISIDQNQKGLTLLDPKWNNSFGSQKPYWSILWFLCLVLYLGVVFIESIGLTWKIIGALFIFVLLLKDGLQNGLDEYMDNKMTMTQLKQYFEELRSAKIQLKYQIISKSSCESIDFPLSRIDDETKDPTIFFEKFNCFRIHCNLSYQFGDEQSKSSYEDLKQNAHNNVKQNIKSKEEITRCSSLKPYILAYNENTELDSIFSQKIYLIFCFLGLSLFYRLYLNTRIPFVEYTVNKTIFVDNNQIIQRQIQQNEKKDIQIKSNLNYLQKLKLKSILKNNQQNIKPQIEQQNNVDQINNEQSPNQPQQ